MDPVDGSKKSVDRVVCRRLSVERDVAEHLSCPYCFGKAADVETGDRQKFCDFKPGEDPVCFGFPETT
jgi:hypothetical protein